MRLYEFEAKELISKYGIPIPGAIWRGTSVDDLPEIESGVVKAQVLANKRMKGGGVQVCSSPESIKSAASQMLGKFIAGDEVKSVLIEDIAEIDSEYYIAITYDPATKTRVLLLNKSGGIDVEGMGDISLYEIDPLSEPDIPQIEEALKSAGFDEKDLEIAGLILKLHEAFVAEDMRLLEVNPLVRTPDKQYVAVGTLVELDDDASYKHKDRSYPPREVGFNRELNEREIAVREANLSDYKGTVKYIEMDGDIGFLAAGGGGSMVAMDEIILRGGSVANYAEHSGNPTKDKVYTLAKSIMQKPGLNGLWIVGAVANFTRIDVTMQGVADALAEVQPKYPIVVRRSGPYEKEGLQILEDVARKYNLDIEIHGSEVAMTSTAKTIVEKAKDFSLKNGDNS